MYIKQKQKRFLAMMLAIVLVVSGIVPQGMIQVSAQEKPQPIYSGRNMSISSAANTINVTEEYLTRLSTLKEGTISVRYRSNPNQGLSALFSLSSTDPGQENTYAVAYVNPTGNKAGVEVRQGNNSNVTNYNQVSATASIRDDQWHTVVYVFGKTKFQIYLDGKKLTEQEKSGFFDKITEADSVKVGALDRAPAKGGTNQWVFSGDIDLVEVYGQALSAEEVAEMQKATAYEPVIPDDPEDAVRTDTRLFYNGYENSASYRIPSLLTTTEGTIIAAIDKRQSGSADQGNIDTVIKRSTDGGVTWEETKTLVNLPSGQNRHALSIDANMVQDRNTGKIFLMVDMFPESNAIMDSGSLVTSSGYKEVNGKKYLILRDCPNSERSNTYTKEYTIRENGIVYDEVSGEATNYVVPNLADGKLFEKIAVSSANRTKEDGISGEEILGEETSAVGTSGEETSENGTPAEETSANGTPAGETSGEAPGNETSKDVTSGDETSKEEASGNETPKDVTSGDITPKDVTPGKETPEEETKEEAPDTITEENTTGEETTEATRKATIKETAEEVSNKDETELQSKVIENPILMEDDGEVLEAEGEPESGLISEQVSKAQPANANDDADQLQYAGNIYLYTGTEAAPLKAVRTSHLWMVTSENDGVDWSEPIDLNGQIKEDWMLFTGTGPGVGMQMSNGRLILPVYITNSNVGGSQSAAVIYSDDAGETWHMGETVNDGRVLSNGTILQTKTMNNNGAMMTESQAVEVTNAAGEKELRLFCRNQGGNVAIATSKDGGETWENTLKFDSVLRDAYCQLTIVPYPYEVPGYEGKEMFLFANPDSTYAAGRNHGTLRLGYYEPQTDEFVWIASRLVEAGNYGYSCLSVLGENQIGLFWEGTNLDQNYTTFNLQWLMADKTPVERTAPAVQGVRWEGSRIEVTFDQPMMVIGSPHLEASADGEPVSMEYDSGSGTTKLLFRPGTDDTHELTFRKITAEGRDFYGNAQNIGVAEGGFDGFTIPASQGPSIETVIKPGYSSIKINFVPAEGITEYDIYRSEDENGTYEKIGSTKGTSYIDQTGAGKTYYYQVRSKDGNKVSDKICNNSPTGIESMKENAVLYQDLAGQKFNGSTLVDASEKAAEVGKLSTGSVLIKFRTTDKSGNLMMLMGKTAGESTAINGSVNKASFYLEKSDNLMRYRADMKHTRASVAGIDYADGEWHTAMVTQADSGYVFRFAIDGVDRGKFTGDSNKGFFSTVQNLNQLTIGGYYNGNTQTVSNGFKGEIAYVVVTDEAASLEDTLEITKSESGILCDLPEQMFDQSKDNTWVFTGGTDVEGGYGATQGIRYYVGQFEEYIRWTKNGGVMGRQRYMINTGKAGNTIADVKDQFEKLVGKYDPRALAVMVGEEDYQAGTEGLEAFKASLQTLADKALGLRDGTGYLVIQTPYAQADESRNQMAAAYAEAVHEVYEGFSDAQKSKVMVADYFKNTDHESFKKNCLDEQGKINALGHLEIAKQFAKVTYGTAEGFPVSEGDLSLRKVKTPSTYSGEAPRVTASDTQLTVNIPDSVFEGITGWRYELLIEDQTISGGFINKQAVIGGLPTGAGYTITVKSEDGDTQLAAVTGTVMQGDEGQIKPVTQTELNDLQKQMKEIVENKKPATWLFVGDSITHGALHTKGYDSIHQTFEKYLKDELGRKDDVVINTAVSGATTAEQEENSNERLDKYNADVVIVMLGTNDASNETVPIDRYKANLESIVDKIHDKGAVAVLRTPNPLRPEAGNRAVNLPRYAEVIRTVAAEKNALLDDHFTEWSKELETRAYLWQNTYWNNDTIHPNPNGQLNMAQSLIRACGLYNETSPICNLSYELPHTEEQSDKAIGAVASGDKIAVDIKVLEETYGSTFGVTKIQAVCDGKTYAASSKKGEKMITLRNLPVNKTYQVTVKADLLETSKSVTFQTETVELKEGEVVIGLGFLAAKLTDLTPSALAGTFYVSALAPEGTPEYSLCQGEKDTDNHKFVIEGDQLKVKETLTEGNTYSVRVKASIGEISEEQVFTIKALGRYLIIDEGKMEIESGHPIDLTGKYIEKIKDLEEGTLFVDFTSANASIQSLFSVSLGDDTATAAQNTHMHVYTSGENLGVEIRNQKGDPVFDYKGAELLKTGVIRIGEQNKVIFRADKEKGSYQLFVNGKLEFELAASVLGGYKYLSDMPHLNTVTIGATMRGGAVKYTYAGSMEKLQYYGVPLNEETCKSMTKVEGYEQLDPPFHSNDATGSSYFRIPAMLTTMQGTVISAIDARFGGTQDAPNNLDTAVSTSTDGGRSWSEGILPFHFDDFADNGQIFKEGSSVSVAGSAAFIDPALLEDRTINSDGRIFILVDAFPSATGTLSAQKGSGYTLVDGKKYLKLKKAGETEYNYTVRENNVIYDQNGAPTEYSLNGNFEVLKNGEPLTVKQKDIEYNNDTITTVTTDQDVAMNVMYDTSVFQVLRTSYLYLKYSDDQGKTWSDPVNLNGMVKTDDMGFLGVGPGRGIQIVDGEHKGRLLFQVYEYVNGDQWCHTIYSDDHGETWKLGGSPQFDRATVGSMSESQLFELPGGTLQVFARTVKSRIATAYSKDGGETWTNGALDDRLLLASGSGCQLSVINYDGYIDGKRAVILSAPVESSRRHGVIRIGLINDDISNGEEYPEIDWKYQFDVTKTGVYFAYSCLTQLPNADVGILYEQGNTRQFLDKIRYNTYSVSKLTQDAYESQILAGTQNAAGGKTSISKQNDTYTIHADANEGYEFVRWTLDKAEVSTEADFAFQQGGETAFAGKTLHFMAEFQEAVNPPTETFTVRFLGKDGNLLKAQNVEKGKDATAPNPPEIEGYEFIGWDKDYSNVQSNLDVMAVYKEISVPSVKYTVRFLDRDGKLLKEETVEKGKDATAPNPPSIAGYTFMGWDKAYTNVQGNLVVKATYQKNPVNVEKITLNKKDIRLAKGKKVKLTAKVSPSNADEIAVMWTSSNEKAAVVDSKGRITAKAPGTAVITAESRDGSNVKASCRVRIGYGVTYKLNKGKNATSNPSVFLTNETTKLKKAARKGYTFAGWYTDKNYKNKIKEIKKGTKKNITVYAKWKKISVDRVKSLTLKTSGKDRIRVRFGKTSGADGYLVKYSTSKDFRKSMARVRTGRTNPLIQNLKTGRTYYVKVRAYKIDSAGKRVFGKYSSVEKIRLENK